MSAVDDIIRESGCCLPSGELNDFAHEARELEFLAAKIRRDASAFSCPGLRDDAEELAVLHEELAALLRAS